MKQLFYLFILILYVYAEEKVRYDGYKVYRVSPLNNEQRNVLIDLEKNNDYYFWTSAISVRPVDILVKPELQNKFKNVLNTNGMNPEILIEDVQSKIDAEVIGSFNDKQINMTWDKYYALEDIFSWLYHLKTVYPEKCDVIKVGESGEHREITGLTINLTPSAKQVIIIEGGIHANEWISPASVTYLINELLTTTDPAFKRIAESFEWYLIPSLNPDGYLYTHETNRMWRKTRSVNTSLPCIGVDANRNWDARWMEHASNDSCSNNFAGTAPFSEWETYWFSNLIQTVTKNKQLVAYLSLHSYGQMILLPYGHTTEHLDNYDEMMQISQKCIEALSKKHGTVYDIGNIPELLYPATGNTVDWVKQTYGTNISIAYEFRDKGNHGFLLPADQIIPNAEEFVDSLIGLFEEAEKFGYVALQPEENYY